MTGVALKATYVTNGVAHARLLAQKGLSGVSSGGLLRPQTEAIVGAPAVSSIQQYNFTKAFMGATAWRWRRALPPRTRGSSGKGRCRPPRPGKLVPCG